jgi:hypothetical protein
MPCQLVDCNQHFQRKCCSLFRAEDFSTLKMETAGLFKTLVAIYQTVLGKLIQMSDDLPSLTALKAKAAYPSETLVVLYQTTWRHVPEGNKLHSCCSGSLKFHSFLS